MTWDLGTQASCLLLSGSHCHFPQRQAGRMPAYPGSEEIDAMPGILDRAFSSVVRSRC